MGRNIFLPEVRGTLRNFTPFSVPPKCFTGCTVCNKLHLTSRMHSDVAPVAKHALFVMKSGQTSDYITQTKWGTQHRGCLDGVRSDSRVLGEEFSVQSAVSSQRTRFYGCKVQLHEEHGINLQYRHLEVLGILTWTDSKGAKYISLSISVHDIIRKTAQAEIRLNKQWLWWTSLFAGKMPAGIKGFHSATKWFYI